MFGRKKKNKEELIMTPKELQSISQDDLYLLFIDEVWSSMKEASRLAVLQEVENRRAAADGREPAKVCVGDKDAFSQPGSLGVYFDGVGEIHLNYRYFSDKSPFHSGAGALGVLLHEGRHAYQFFRIHNGITDQSAEILKEWASSQGYYIAPDGSAFSAALYGLQAIEDDARRFSRRELQKVIHNLMLRGIDSRSFVREYQEALQTEGRFIMMIRENLTIEELDEFESLIIQSMQDLYPKLNIGDLRLFDNAKLILEAKLESFEDLTILLDQLDRLADEKLNKLQEKRLNRI